MVEAITTLDLYGALFSEKNMEKNLETIHNAGLKFLEPLTLEETSKLVTEEAVKLVGAQWGGLFLADNHELHQEAVYPQQLKVTFLPRKRGFTYKAYRYKKTFTFNKQQIVKIHPELKKNGFTSALCMPLSYHGKSIGAIILFSRRENKFSQREQRVLTFFGSYASLALRKAKLHNDLKSAHELRDYFISMAAHELRTPLTSVNGYIQLLHKKTRGANTTESVWIEQLWKESTRLTKLIGDLLEINRIKAGKLQYAWKECSLREICKRAINTFRFGNQSRALLFEDNLNGHTDIVIGDFDRLLQVITNLLDNAVKFSPEKSPVTLALQFRSPYYCLMVKDEGEGIDRKDAERIFDGFYKGKHHTKPGMGLGLYIAKDIVSKHHGIISARTKEKQGTTIEIKLPKGNV